MLESQHDKTSSSYSWRYHRPGYYYCLWVRLPRRNDNLFRATYVDHLHPFNRRLVPDRPLAGTIQRTNHIQSKAILASTVGDAVGRTYGNHLARIYAQYDRLALVHFHSGRKCCFGNVRLARGVSVVSESQSEINQYNFPFLEAQNLSTMCTKVTKGDAQTKVVSPFMYFVSFVFENTIPLES